MTEADMRKVVIIQESIPQYRVPFFDGMYEQLRARNIELQVLYGEPDGAMASRGDTRPLSDKYGVTIKNRRLLAGRLLYQPVWPYIKNAQLVITPHASRQIITLLLLLAGRWKTEMRVALWGLGWNRLASAGSFSERYKRWQLPLADWHFAYTTGVADYLETLGVAGEHITVMFNSVDTSGFRDALEQVTPSQMTAFRQHHDIPETAIVGLYCGNLSTAKRLEMLVELAHRIHQDVQAFHLVIAGDGPERSSVEEVVSTHDYLHYVGPIFGENKAVCFKQSALFLCTGYVGLAILDGFTAGLPMMTVDSDMHSPEIEYLEPGVNGLTSDDHADAMAKDIVTLLQQEDRLASMQQAAEASSQYYSMDRMVTSCTEGILQALGMKAP